MADIANVEPSTVASVDPKNGGADQDMSKAGIQTIFKQREVDAPMVKNRRWLQQRKFKCREVNIFRIESYLGDQGDLFENGALIALMLFYGSKSVMRNSEFATIEQLRIMDRRADKEIDEVARAFNMLHPDRRMRFQLTLGAADDTTWGSRKKRQFGPASYATFAKITQRHAANTKRRSKMSPDWRNSPLSSTPSTENSANVRGKNPGSCLAPHVILSKQKEDNTTLPCPLCPSSEVHHPKDCLRLSICKNHEKPMFFERDGASGTLQTGNQAMAWYGAKYRTYRKN